MIQWYNFWINFDLQITALYLFIYLFIYLFFEAVEDVTEIGSDLFEITHKWGFN